MNSLAFFGTRTSLKPVKKRYFFWRKILETPIFLDLFSERMFLHFVGNEKGQLCETRHD
jgi:hypothetical protein